MIIPDDLPSSGQIEAYRALSGEKRVQISGQLYWVARKMKAAGLRYQHPDWPEDRIKSEVTRIFLDARS